MQPWIGLTFATFTAFGAGFGLNAALNYRKVHPMHKPFHLGQFIGSVIAVFCGLSLVTLALHYAVEWTR